MNLSGKEIACLLGTDIHQRGQPSLQNRLLISSIEDPSQLQVIAEAFGVEEAWQNAQPPTGERLLEFIDFTNYQTPNQRLLLFIRLDMPDYFRYYLENGATNFDEAAELGFELDTKQLHFYLLEKVSLEYAMGCVASLAMPF